MRASGASLVRGTCTTGSRMRCLEPSNAQRKLGGCHPFGVPVEHGLLAARSSESGLCRQPLRPEQSKRRMAQCCPGEFVGTRRLAPAIRIVALLGSTNPPKHPCPARWSGSRLTVPPATPAAAYAWVPSPLRRASRRTPTSVWLLCTVQSAPNSASTIAVSACSRSISACSRSRLSESIEHAATLAPAGLGVAFAATETEKWATETARSSTPDAAHNANRVARMWPDQAPSPQHIQHTAALRPAHTQRVI